MKKHKGWGERRPSWAPLRPVPRARRPVRHARGSKELRHEGFDASRPSPHLPTSVTPIVFVALFVCSNAAAAKSCEPRRPRPTRRDRPATNSNTHNTHTAQHDAHSCSPHIAPLPVRFLPSIPPCVCSLAQAAPGQRRCWPSLLLTDCQLRHPASRPACLRPHCTHTRMSVSSLHPSFLRCPSSSVRPFACPTVPLLAVPVPFGFFPRALLCVPAAWRGLAWQA
jgi:hypothetical protein